MSPILGPWNSNDFHATKPKLGGIHYAATYPLHTKATRILWYFAGKKRTF